MVNTPTFLPLRLKHENSPLQNSYYYIIIMIIIIVPNLDAGELHFGGNSNLLCPHVITGQFDQITFNPRTQLNNNHLRVKGFTAAPLPGQRTVGWIDPNEQQTWFILCHQSAENLN